MAVTEISPAVILHRVAQLTSARIKNPKNAEMAMAEMHRVPRAGLFGAQYDPIYLQLIGCYRESDYLNRRITSSQLTRDELIIYERSINRFLEISEQAKKGALKLIPIVMRQMEENVPFAHFFAGAFSLARGEMEAALIHFSEGADLRKVKDKLIDAINEERTDEARSALGPWFAKVEQFLRGSSTPPPSAAESIKPPVTPPAIIAPPAAPPAFDPEKAKKFLSQAEQQAGKQEYLAAFRSIAKARDNDPQDKKIQERFGQIRGFALAQVRDLERDHEAQLKAAREFLAVKADETEVLLIAGRTSLKFRNHFGNEETLRFAASARKLSSDHQATDESWYLEGLALCHLHRHRESLTALEHIRSGSFFEKALNWRMMQYSRERMFEEGQALLRSDEDRIADYRVLEFKALLAAEDKTVESLEKAHDLALAAGKEANRSGQYKLAGHFSRSLADPIMTALLRAREARIAEKRRKEAPAPAPAPAPSPTPAPVQAPPTPSPADIRKAELDARESGLNRLAAELKRNREELEQLNKHLEIKQAEQARLKAELDDRARQLTEQEALPRQQTVEVRSIDVSRPHTAKERQVLDICGRIIRGEYEDAEAELKHLKTSLIGNVTINALLALFELIDKLHPEEIIKRVAGLNARIEQQEAELTELRKGKRSLEDKLAGAEQTIRQQQQHLSRLISPLRTFNEWWDILKGRSAEALAAEHLPLAGLFVVELATKKKGLTAEEIWERRKHVIGAIVERRQRGEEAFSTYFLENDRSGFSSITNKRIFPGGYRQAREWAEALLALLS